MLEGDIVLLSHYNDKSINDTKTYFCTNEKLFE